MFSLSQAEKTYQLIKPYITKTPLVRCFELEKHLGNNHRIFMKCEHLQPTGSFKIRGAFASLLHLTDRQKKQGIITRSSGNFATAIAYAGKMLGVPVTIVMPPNAPLVKQENTKKLGATVLLHGYTHIEQMEKVKEIATEKHLTMLHPYDHIDMIYGSATMGLEITAELSDIDFVYCQIGGGGLMGGLSASIKTMSPDTQVIGVEPEGANDYFLSTRAGHRVIKKDIHTIADGLKAPQVGDINYPLLQKYVDDVQLVSDETIMDGMQFLYNHMKMIVEPSGAVSFSYLLKKNPRLFSCKSCLH